MNEISEYAEAIMAEVQVVAHHTDNWTFNFSSDSGKTFSTHGTLGRNHMLTQVTRVANDADPERPTLLICLPERVDLKRRESVWSWMAD